MITLSKKARLSLQVLMFGATLLTGVSAFAMDQDKKTASDANIFSKVMEANDFDEIQSQISVIDKCIESSAHRTDFHACLDQEQKQTTAGDNINQISREMPTLQESKDLVVKGIFLFQERADTSMAASMLTKYSGFDVIFHKPLKVSENSVLTLKKVYARLLDPDFTKNERSANTDAAPSQENKQ